MRQEPRYVPGMRIALRDAEWRIDQVQNPSHGGKLLTCTGQSELVRGLTARFLTDLEQAPEILAPENTELLDDVSAGYTATQLRIQALLESTPPADNKIHLGHQAAMDVLPYQLDPAPEFNAEDRVGIVSLMDHTPGQRQFRDLTALRIYLSKKRNLNEQEFQDHVANLKRLQSEYGEDHETGAVTHAARYGAVLASHDDTTEEQVKTSLTNGVTFAEFPTTLEAAQACRENGILIMMGAPNIVRGKSHSGNVSAAELADANLLDIISSDYVPSALLLSVFYLAERWNDLPRAVACATGNAAKAAGLRDRGLLQTGLRGDVLRVAVSNRAPLIRGGWSQGRRVA